MAVSAVMAAISTATTAFTTGAFILGSALTHFLVTTAMGAALNALTPKPKLANASRGYSISGESGSALDHQIIYGTSRVGGVRIYDTATGTNNNFLHRIIAFAGHEITSYDQIYLNDEVVTIQDTVVYTYKVTYYISFDGSDPVPYVIENKKSEVNYAVGQSLTEPQLVALIGYNPFNSENTFVSATVNTKTSESFTGNVVSPAKYKDHVRIKRYFGTTTQTADTDLIAETASSADGNGLAITAFKALPISMYVSSTTLTFSLMESLLYRQQSVGKRCMTLVLPRHLSPITLHSASGTT